MRKASIAVRVLGPSAALALLLAMSAPVQAEQETPHSLKVRCDAGSKVACNQWGNALEHGHGVAQDEAAARAAYASACELGEPFSCTNVGLLMQDGRGGATDPVGAMPWLRRGCHGGDSKGCAWVAKLARDIETLRDPAMSAEYNRRGCEMADGVSCTWWGIALEDGAGVAMDLPAALAAYAKACDLSVAGGCYNAWFLLEQPKMSTLVEDRLVQAAEFARRGCGMGHVNACIAYGVDLDEGLVVARDQSAARAKFEWACNRQSGLGCYNFSILLTEGRGGPRDRKKGREMAAKACELGYRDGC